ncbi:MAG: radical SAM family heme chaperone HemW [Acidobacteriota bacterium]
MRGASSGIYVHLPYCASRCGYCAFVVTTDGSSRDAYLGAVQAEAALVSGEAAGTPFDAIYLGGGTPSLLPPEAIARLLATLRERFAIDSGSEVTLEANPEDVTAGAAAAWSRAGVNRVSVGVQSLSDAELAAVGRRHDAGRARAALATLADSGLSISGDLILGLPFQTADSFASSLSGLCEAGVAHVSVYLLETEKTKTIEDDRRLHPERYLSDDAQADVWLAMGETLAAGGFVHYEISNWARPGREARHNVKYWTRTPTVGLGVSAHELWAGRRRANVSNLEQYLERLRAGRRPIALDEGIAPEKAAREEIFLGLRLRQGVPAAGIEAFLARDGDERLRDDYADWLAEGILERNADRVRFTERGYLVSNEVLSRFV